jgi:hypothetical protein
MTAEVLYRYEVDAFETMFSGIKYELKLREFPIIKRTPRGAWIYGYTGKRFVNLGARKQFACATEPEAKESFIRRKERQIKILKGQLKRAEQGLIQAQQSKTPLTSETGS